MSSFLRITLSAVMVTRAVASCAYGTTLRPRAEGTVAINDFGYAGALGPANWFSLNTTTNSACAEGSHQSPIDMTNDVYTEVAGSELYINIPDFSEGATFENLGTTIEVIGENGTLTIPNSNKTFNFAQFHFHTPSEHLANGTAMPMEAHFVFQADDAEISVIGVYIDIADAATAAASMNYSAHQAKAVGASAVVNSAASGMVETVLASAGDISAPGSVTTTSPLVMSDFVSYLQTTTFRTYSGSLTTPPCSEGVNWFVSTDMLTVSLSSFKAAREVIGFNSRYAQSPPGEQNVLSAFFSTMSTGSIPSA